MKKQLKNLAVIPARGGSKRIPGKNIKTFAGKPIIAHAIEVARESGLFDEIMVSTEDKKIASVAEHYGASVPFLRSRQNAGDYATLSDVLIEVTKMYKKEKETRIENLCCILPTAVFLQAEDLKKAYDKMINERLDAVFPVVRYDYPIQRALRFQGDKIKMIWPENLRKRSQDLEPAYHDAGLFYWIKTSVLSKEKTLWPENTGAVILPAYKVQDIDTPEDWEMAELKYKILHERK